MSSTHRASMTTWLRRSATVALVLMTAACATIPPNAGQDPRDPFERFNRHVFEFNEQFDEAIFKPAARAYRDVLPQPMRECFGNAFSNLRGPSHVINNLLQGKPADAWSDTCRFVINTTVGVLGCFDVATRMGFEQRQEDFGQTLGVWGFGPGPYLVLPIFGPSSVRDAIGVYGAEYYLDLNFWLEPDWFRYTVFTVRAINDRAQLLQAEALVSAVALDKYSFIRDGYLQRRRNLVYDGEPPRLPDPDDEAAASRAWPGPQRVHWYLPAARMEPAAPGGVRLRTDH